MRFVGLIIGMILTVGALLPSAARAAVDPAETQFPYGFWMGDGDYNQRWSAILGESYPERFEKIVRHFQTKHVNALIPSHTALGKWHLDTAERYDMRLATMPNYLYSHLRRQPIDNPKPMEWVTQSWREHIDAIGDHPALLAYHMYDEPIHTMCGPIETLARYISSLGRKAPAIYTQQSLPIDEATHPTEWSLLKFLDVILSDCYSLHGPMGRDAWFYGDIALGEFRRPNPNAHQWPIIQSFGYGQYPTVPEIRVMVYNTIANGAKGMFFFVAGQSYIAWHPTQPGYIAPGNLWFGDDAYMAEVERIGAHLTTAGPLLLPLDYAPAYRVRVESESFTARIRPALRPTGPVLRRQAIHAGAFRGKTYDILIVHNNDPWQSHTGKVTLPDSTGKQVYDLLTLEPVGKVAARGVEFSVDFEAGDGRLYLVGDEREFSEASRVVWQHRSRHLLTMLRHEADASIRAGVQAEMVVSRLNELQEQPMNTADAYERLIGAQTLLAKQKLLHQSYQAISSDIEATRSTFVKINQWFTQYPEYLQRSSYDDKAQIDELVAAVVALSGRFSRLENAMHHGKIELSEASALRQKVTALRERVEGFQLNGRESKRIAILQFGNATDGLNDLKRWLGMLYTEVDLIDADKWSSANYDLVWIHLDGESSAIDARYCESTQLPPQLLGKTTVDELRQWTESGGGIVLTGLAAGLVVELGVERLPPNEAYWGTMFTPGNVEMKWESWGRCGKVIGLKPKVSNHPLFAGLAQDGFGVEMYDEAEIISKAVWNYQSIGGWRGNGKVLAGYYSDGAAIPDQFAVTVEYTLGNGHILAFGDVFDPYLGATAVSGLRGRASRWDTTYHTLLRNIVTTYALSK